LENYTGLRCFEIDGTFEGEDDFDFVNLQVLPLPYENYVNCANCILWINPKVWSTTPEKWGQGTDVAFRKWQFE
jgi:hypothetical protein